MRCEPDETAMTVVCHLLSRPSFLKDEFVATGDAQSVLNAVMLDPHFTLALEEFVGRDYTACLPIMRLFGFARVVC